MSETDAAAEPTGPLPAPQQPERRPDMLNEMGSGVSVPTASGNNVVQVGDKRVKIVKVVPVKVIKVSASETPLPVNDDCEW